MSRWAALALGCSFGVLVAGALAREQVRAASIVVDGGGQDALQAAINQANPGDVILVKPGDYDDKDPDVDLRIARSGSSSAPITLKADGSPRARIGNVLIENASFWIIDGFRVAEQGSLYAINIVGQNSEAIVLRNLLVHDNRFCIHLKEGKDHLVENSVIYNCVNSVNPDNQDAHGIEVRMARNSIIRYNQIFGFTSDGIHLMRRDDNAPIDRGTTMIMGNLIYNTRGPCAENAVDIKSEVGTVIIRSNVMYGFQPLTGAGCQYKGSGDPAGSAILAHVGSSGTLIIERNLFYDMYAGIDNRGMKTTIQNNIFRDFHEGMVLWSTSKHLGVIEANSNTTIYHNTFVRTPHIFHETAEGGHTAINNLFYQVDATRSGSPLPGTYRNNGWFNVHPSQVVSATGDVTGTDPRLNSDLSLKGDSRCIDSGAGVGVSEDFLGGPRPRGIGPDIGAFEYAGAIQPSPTFTPSGPATATSTPSSTSAATVTPSATPSATLSTPAEPAPTPASAGTPVRTGKSQRKPRSDSLKQGKTPSLPAWAGLRAQYPHTADLVATWLLDVDYPKMTSWHLNIAARNLTDGLKTLEVSQLHVKLPDDSIQLLDGSEKPDSYVLMYSPLHPRDQMLIAYLPGSDGQGVFQLELEFRMPTRDRAYGLQYRGEVITTLFLGP